MRDDDRLLIDVTGGDLHVHADEAWDALMRANDPTFPRVMVRGNDLVRKTERGELEPFSVDSLRDELSKVAVFIKVNAKGETVPVKPPAEVAKVILARDSADYEDGPRVDRIVDIPVLGIDGKLIDTPGHHEASRLLYEPDPALKLPAVAGEIGSHEDVWRAVDVLMDDLLGDFGFEDEASKANALALLLLPFVREYIGDRPTPMHLIVAPEVGTGKTLLALSLLMPGCGLVDLTPEATDEDEIRKRITAQLLAGKPAIVLDNIAGSISSSVLAGAITTGKWSDRVLKESREVRLPIRNAWVATGNNVELTDEHNRRAVPIILDPGDVRPSDRPKQAFRHDDLVEWAQANRGRLVDAALTLVRNWIDGGEVVADGETIPVASERTLGTFERWAEVVGGILAAAGIKGFLGNRDRMSTINVEREETSAFLSAWHGLGLVPQTLEEVIALCAFDQPLHPFVPEALRIEHPARFKQKIMYWLRDHKGAKYGGFKLVKTTGRPARWEVVSLHHHGNHGADDETSATVGKTGDVAR